MGRSPTSVGTGGTDVGTGKAMTVEYLRPALDRVPDRIDAGDVDTLVTVAEAVDSAVAAWLARIGADGRRLYVSYGTADFEPGLRMLVRSLRTVSPVPILVFTIGDWTFRHEAADVAAVAVPKIVKADVPTSSRPNAQWAMISKLWVFSLTQVGRIVYLDADCLVLGEIEDLFAEPGFAAAPDLFTAGTRTFNAGVFTVAPTAAMRRDLYATIAVFEPRSPSDQELLNVFFSDWTRLPVAYNFLRTYGLVLGPCPDSRMRVLHYTLNRPWTFFSKRLVADMALAPYDRLWTERLTDAEQDELSRNWRARLDEFEARFSTEEDVRAEIGHAREIVVDALRGTRRRLYVALAAVIAVSMVQTAVIAALLLR